MRQKSTYADPYLEAAKQRPGEWCFFMQPNREEVDKIARWLRRNGAFAKFMQLDNRWLLAVKT